MTALLRIVMDQARVVSECAANSRVHWRTKHRMSNIAKEAAFIATKEALGETTIAPPITLTCTRYYTGRSKEMDDDNLPASMKPFVDGIKTALGFDDAPRFMTIVCKQEKAPVHRLEFTIEQREEVTE